jgi:DNA-binding Xre family transcriptional regulator
MKWNLRLVAAQRDIWKASQLQAMLAEAGLVVSAGKMSHLWSAQPVTIRLEDLQIICSVLRCTPNDLLVFTEEATSSGPAIEPAQVSAAAGGAPLLRRHVGRARPPV